MNPRLAIYRVDLVSTAGRRFIGTSFAITSQHLVTCKHVLDQKRDDERVVVWSTALEGDLSADEWICHEGGRDFALGILTTSRMQNWIPHQSVLLGQLPDELECCGYIADGGTLQVWKDRVSGVHNDHGWVALQNSTLPGVSGGPVLLAEHAVGLVIAKLQAQKFVLPMTHVVEWLIEHGVAPSAQPNVGLAKVPIGPAVRAADIPETVIWLFENAFPVHALALQFVFAVENLVLANNVERFRPRQIMPSKGSLLPPGTPMESFWRDTLWQAGAKSRRTMAAFFYAEGSPSLDLLPAQDREQVKSFIAWLNTTKDRFASN